MSEWKFDPEEYLQPSGYGQAKIKDDHTGFFRALFKNAHLPIDRGAMWRMTAQKSGMSVEELWFYMNRTNAFLGCAPFYGGDAEGFTQFMSLQKPDDLHAEA